jgi:DNA polymerase III delta subunit
VTASAPVAYLWGDDAFGLDAAVRELATAWGVPGEPLEIWRAPLDDEEIADGSSASRRRARALDEIAGRVATAPLFGGGTLVVVRQPGWIAREKTALERLVAIVGSVPPGNGLAFSDLLAADSKAPAAGGALRDAVVAAGGTHRELRVPSRDRMEAWVATRAADLGVRMGPGAARLLAERVGGYVRETDVDRRRQTQLANTELEKLALYRPGGVVEREDVAALVAEAIPGSTWAFLDAIGTRRGGEASRLAERLLSAGTPLPLLIAQIHRRLRELISVREHLDEGARPGDLVRALRVAPFRAQKLAEQASAWSAASLDRAIGGLVDLDLRSKGITLDGSTAQMSETRDALGIQVWIAEQLATG